MTLFPYTPRQNQQAIMSTITQTLNNRGHVVLESGTGSGKTICALSATLTFALEHNKKIIYATRTNSQQQQVIIELRAMREHQALSKKKEPLFGVGIQGRSNMCLLAHNDTELSQGTAEELSRFCANEKKKARSSKEHGCNFYRTFVEDKEQINRAIQWVKAQLPTAEEFIAYCQHNSICPYELNKLLVRDARIVVVPYVYIFNSTIRNMLFDWLGSSEEDMILIIDEAHNLPDYLRDLFSNYLSVWMVRNCIYEVEQYGNPSTLDGQCTIASFCKTLEEIIRELRDTYVYIILETGLRINSEKKTDAFLSSHEFLTELLSRMGVTSKQLHSLIDDLIAYGEQIQERKQKQNKLPRSYLHKLGMFLDFWINLVHEQYVKLIVDAAEGKNPRIEAYCLDPSVGTDTFFRFYSTIHMSGTLEPLEEYRDSLGLPPTTTLVSFPSPFPKENRKIVYVNDVTTKYSELVRDETAMLRMWQYVSSICNTFPQNTMVCFPSFNTLSMFQRTTDFSSITRSVFLEEQQMSQSALMELISDFKSYGETEGDRAALFSVMGGRISEGMDFPAEQLEIVVIIGIPYPKPTARQRGLQRYYDMKFRRGWEYTVEAPTARKLLQTIGRLIRNESDRGIAIILDRRAPRFKKYIRDLEPTSHLLQDVKDFLNR